MSRKEQIEVICRYIDGTANEEERGYAEYLLANCDNDVLIRSLVKKDWDKIVDNPLSEDFEVDHLLCKVHDTIRHNEYEAMNKPIRRLIRMYSKIAAIMLIPILLASSLAYFGLKGHYKSDSLAESTIYAPLGSRISFSLPDGTTGMLNGGSVLSYSLPFTNNRNVELDGEGWFEVSSDENHPFTVKVGSSAVKVLGTKFNVNGYSNLSYVELVLEEGKVDFVDNEMNINETLNPSERLVLSGGKVTKSITEVDKHIGWMEGKLIFRGDCLQEVVQRIERWYNVDIEIADQSLLKYSFRATFQDDSLEDIIRFLSMTSPISYSISPAGFDENGNWLKTKIILYQK